MSKATEEAYEKLSRAMRQGGAREATYEETYAMEIGYSEGYKQALIDQTTPEQL